MDFGKTGGLGAGRKDKGRPMVWRPARYARRWATVGSPLFTYFPCCLHVLHLLCMQQWVVHHLHLPCTQKWAGMSFFNAIHMSSTSLTCNSEMEVDLFTLSEPLAPQGHMAVSIDTHTALVRLLGQFWSHTCVWVCVPPGFLKPLPQPIKIHTLWCRYRFAWVRVWVALEYPRVTCDNL